MVAMDEDTSKLYIQNLEEYVLDEAKIVTYKWLSREFNLHVNFAKQLLLTFLQQHKKIVHGTYLLSGQLKDEITHKVLIVQEEDLEKAKLQFKIISSEHVYCVQKSKKLTDLNSLYIIDRFSKDNSDTKRFYKKMSTVHCDDAVEKASDEIARLKIEVKASAGSTSIRSGQDAKKKTITENDAAATTSAENVATKNEEKQELKSSGVAALFAAQGMKSLAQKNVLEQNDAAATTSAENVATKNEEKKQLKSSGFAALFAAQGMKSLAQKNVPEQDGAAATTSEEKVATKKEEKKQKKNFGIAAMFAAQGMKSLAQKSIAEKSKGKGKPIPDSETCTMFLNKNAVKTKEKTEPVQLVAKQENIHEVGDESKSCGGEIWRKGTSKSEPAQKKKKVSGVKNSHDDSASLRKRKRILYVSDSESDDGIFVDDYDDEEEEEEAPNFPLLVSHPASVPLVESDKGVAAPTLAESEKEVEAPTPQGETKPRRRRERKLKLTTYLDEEGYVVTKSLHAVESCSDSEEEEKCKKRKTEENNTEKLDDKKCPTLESPSKKKYSPQKVKQTTLMGFLKKQ